MTLAEATGINLERREVEMCGADGVPHRQADYLIVAASARDQGGFTRHQPSGEQTTIVDAAQRYAAESVPLLVIVGKEYGFGSPRDWAARHALLGVRALLPISFKKIHRSNVIGMRLCRCSSHRAKTLLRLA